MSLNVAIVYHSAFKGNIKRLATRIGVGAAKVDGAEVRLIPVEEVDDNWNYLHECHAMILGSPTYVGSLSAAFKTFIEQLAGEVWLERKWLNKVSGGFTCSAGRSGDKFNCLLDLLVFATQMGMVWVPMPMTGGNYSSTGSENDLNRMAGYLGVMAQANIDEPAELAPPESDLMTAEIYGEHIARVAAAMAAGGVITTPDGGNGGPALRPWNLRDA
ncbi:flavodoxin family protein [Polymorphobacter sp.]|uniref:flavodoxin family protein n=1 Tax=Polymorphobacter sp. TaxID=1909290 RepID=UPI003F7202B6